MAGLASKNPCGNGFWPALPPRAFLDTEGRFEDCFTCTHTHSSALFMFSLPTSANEEEASRPERAEDWLPEAGRELAEIRIADNPAVKCRHADDEDDKAKCRLTKKGFVDVHLRLAA